MATSTFAAPLGTPVFKATDSAGNPLNGGKLYAYVAGTTTPLDTYPTYTDALAGTNANANPVVLDSAGAAQIWVQATSYKFVLTDSSGSTLYTQDNVGAALGFPISSALTLTTVTKSGDQSSFGSATKLATWTTEYDALSEWSAANNRWVCGTAGKYRVDFSAEASDTSTNVAFTFSIYKNGSVVGRIVSRSSATANQVWGYNAHWAGTCVATDYIEAYVTGGAGTTVKGTIGTRFTVQRVV